MEDARILADYHVQRDTTLHLVIGLRGKMQVHVRNSSGKTLTIDVDFEMETVLDVN